MFFQLNEKTLADLISKQKQREEESAEKARNTVDYQGHQLTFKQAPDGRIVILSEPPLITEVKESEPEQKLPEVPDGQ